eukprot:1846647-Rhodomonas_salina.2
MSLNGVVLSVTGSFDRKKMASIVKKAGGKVENLVHSQVDYLVADEEAVMMNTKQVRKAHKLGIPVVNEQWLIACLKSKQLVSTSEYLHKKEGIKT